MRKLNSLWAAGALVLVANAFTLVHVARNRSGPATQEVTLTDRELQYYRDKDDSGVHLMLQYSSLAHEWGGVPWLDRQKVCSLGFDCSVEPGDLHAYNFYPRQRARTAFVAFEYDGSAWEKAYAALQDANRVESERRGSRLMPIDAAATAAELQSRYTDRTHILILPAVMRIHAEPAYPAQPNRPARPARISAFIVQIPSDIHVPVPYSERFREMTQTFRDEKRETPLYRVTLRYGQFLEPWVAAVDFPR